jgi:alpha-galactosidase
MTNTPSEVIRLTNGGVSLVVGVPTSGLPFVAHWGAEVSESLALEIVLTADPARMNSSIDRPRRFTIAPTQTDGWSGTAALQWHSNGVPAAGLRLATTSADSATAQFELVDDRLSVAARLEYSIDEAGVLAVRGTVTNTGDRVVDVLGIRHLLPVPARAGELLDQTGRWSGERRPQRRPIVDGTSLRSSRRGRPGHDSPLVSLVGTDGFGFRSGEVWATHIAWSGDQEYVTEKSPEGAGALSAVVGGGELLLPGEIRLSRGEAYEGPAVLFTWSDAGIDGISARFHERVRRSPSHPTKPRPLVLNTWEAVYFDHDFDRLSLLAHQAADLGIERFVLDDGWFLGRRNDRAGLGDWIVDRKVWPEGLSRLSTLVHSLGMEFGLWFEPEMINLDSLLARSHPEWILAGPEGPELSWRHQFVLDLANPAAYAHVLGSIDGVVAENGVDFIKWDHNRDLHDAEDSASRSRVHEQTRAVYSMMDALREQHPGLEIESCASGGGRVDLGVMGHAQRVWASDTNDPIERQMVQRWTGVLLPPEVVGAHVGPRVSHTTHRVTSLQFRLITALFGHAGIEWDLTAITPGERESLGVWASVYREFRGLLASGATVRADDVDPGALLHGVVSPDSREALFAWVRVETSPTAHSERVPIPGLDPDRLYVLRVRDDLGAASRHEVADPAWMRTDADDSRAEFSGRLLAEIGIPLPVLNPGNGMLLQFSAVG